MKKFYSIIALASMMLTSVLSLTSCQKDEMPSTIAKTQTAQTSQSQQSVFTTVPQGTTTVSGTTSDGVKVNATVTNNGTQVTGHVLAVTDPQVKVKDTSFIFGTWKATVDGTDYTIVVSSNLTYEDKIYKEYKATFYAGDKTYEGVFTCPLIAYAGEFSSDARAAGGMKMIHVYCGKINESSLAEYTAEGISIDGKDVAQNVTFVKQ